MIKFLWKYKYLNLCAIFITFISLLFNISKVNVFFDSERIIELSNVDKSTIEKSLDDSNLLLVGLKFKDKLDFQKINSINNKVNEINKQENISNIKSIFNEKKINESLPISFPIKVLKFKTQNEYENSINRISKLKSNFICEDFKNLLFVIKCKNLETDEEKENFLNFLEKKFNDINDSKVFITGQIKSEIYMQKKYDLKNEKE